MGKAKYAQVAATGDEDEAVFQERALELKGESLSAAALPNFRKSILSFRRFHPLGRLRAIPKLGRHGRYAPGISRRDSSPAKASRPRSFPAAADAALGAYRTLRTPILMSTDSYPPVITRRTAVAYRRHQQRNEIAASNFFFPLRTSSSSSSSASASSSSSSLQQRRATACSRRGSSSPRRRPTSRG